MAILFVAKAENFLKDSFLSCDTDVYQGYFKTEIKAVVVKQVIAKEYIKWFQDYQDRLNSTTQLYDAN